VSLLFSNNKFRPSNYFKVILSKLSQSFPELLTSSSVTNKKDHFSTLILEFKLSIHLLAAPDFLFTTLLSLSSSDFISTK